MSRWLAAAVLLIASAMPAPAADRDGAAVIIGNRSYAGGVPAVAYAHRDADAVKRFVVEVLGYREGNVLDLRDATQAEMYSVFGSREDHRGRAFGLVRPGKTDLLVFYSGHGVPGLNDRRGYLLPANADPVTASINGYPIDLLYANLAKLGARSVTVLIDACFSGDSAGGALVRSASPVFLDPALPRAGGLTVLTAASGAQLANWDEAAGHGLFTRHLLEALYGRADGGEWGDGDGRITLAEVSAYLNDEMRYQARRLFSREQVPTIQGDPATVLLAYPPGRPPQPPALVPKPPIPVPRPAVGSYPGSAPRSGNVFTDCAGCPSMVVLPAGRFAMGSPAGEPGRFDNEGPVRQVVLARSFAVGRHEITRAEWAAFVQASGHVSAAGCGAWDGTEMSKDPARSWAAPGFAQGEADPVVCVSWREAKLYVAWLAARTGKPYRLLSEAEWEYAARAGSSEPRFWGARSRDGCGYANLYDRAARDALGQAWRYADCRDGHVHTAPAGSYRPNPFGLHAMLGNVWEWVEDCWADSHAGAPVDGAARLDGDCAQRVRRGGSWLNHLRTARAAMRGATEADKRAYTIGFRVARDLD